MRTLERRLKLLKLEGDGFNTSEVVKNLSEQFQCSERTVYYDMANRGLWQPRLQQLDSKKLLLRVLNRLEQIYRKASFKYLQSKDEKMQLGSLRVMLDATARVGDMAIIVDLEQRVRKLEEKEPIE